MSCICVCLKIDEPPLCSGTLSIHGSVFTNFAVELWNTTAKFSTKSAYLKMLGFFVQHF